jgi:DHA1 family bicyclomycin/chloramphenicol resistance-like MFS transporter
MRPIEPGSTVFVLLMAGLMTMSAMTIDINLPAIPATAADLGAPTAQIGLTVTIFFVGLALGQAVYGPISDRFGRRPVLIAGIVLFVAASLACAAAADAVMLLAMRLVQGLGAGAGPILGRAIIRDLFHGAQMARVMSYAMAAFITAPILAPSIGAMILLVASWRWIFLFLAGYGLVLLIVAAMLVRETLTRPDPLALRPGRIAAAWRLVLIDPDSRLFGAIATLALSGLVIYLANASAVFMTTFGLTPGEFGVAFAGIALCAAIGNLVNARLVRQVPLVRLIGLGAALGAAALAASLALWLAGGSGPWAILPGFAGFFLAFGLIVSNSTTLALAPHGSIVGAATSVLGVIQSVVPAMLGSLVAAAYDGTPVPALTAMLVVTMGACALAARRYRVAPGG